MAGKRVVLSVMLTTSLVGVSEGFFSSDVKVGVSVVICTGYAPAKESSVKNSNKATHIQRDLLEDHSCSISTGRFLFPDSSIR